MKIDFLKNKYFWAVLGATALGFFLRIYRHGDYLFFALDQARDWILVKNILSEGWSQLPLVGSRAGGTNFYLGPVYNYFQTLAAWIFGDSPQKLAYPDLFFSVLSIPLFYFFLKEYFSKKISLALTLLFSVSLFAVEYSRFAWNPNSVPFFVLLIFYSILQLSRESNEKLKWLWLITSAVSLAIAVQLHTLALVGLPLIIFLYFLIIKPSIGWKKFAAGGLIALFVFSPVLLNEFITGFGNAESFYKGLAAKEGAQNNFSSAKKVIRGAEELARNYSTIITSDNFIFKFQRAEFKNNPIEILKINLKDPSERKNLLVSILVFILIMIPLGWFAVRLRLIWRKEGEKRFKNFITIFLLWQAIYLILFTLLAFQQDSRYYLVVAFIPFILLGFYFEQILKIKKIGGFGFLFLLAVLLGLNFLGVKNWFENLNSYEKRSFTPKNTEFILENYYTVTFGQLDKINDFIEGAYRSTGQEVRIAPNPYYQRSIIYLLRYGRNIPASDAEPSSQDKSRLYFLINSTENSNGTKIKLPKKFGKNFEPLERKSFGNLSVLAFKVKDSLENIPDGSTEATRSISDIKKEEQDFCAQKKRKTCKYVWGYFFR